MFKKKNICDILCCLIPIQLLIFCFSRNIDKLDSNALLIMGIMTICFYVKLYFENKKNLEFYTELIKENRKTYGEMIDRLRAEKYRSFNENISESIEKFQRELFKHSERQEAIRKTENRIDK